MGIVDHAFEAGFFGLTVVNEIGVGPDGMLCAASLDEGYIAFVRFTVPPTPSPTTSPPTSSKPTTRPTTEPTVSPTTAIHDKPIEEDEYAEAEKDLLLIILIFVILFVVIGVV